MRPGAGPPDDRRALLPIEEGEHCRSHRLVVRCSAERQRTEEHVRPGPRRVRGIWPLQREDSVVDPPLRPPRLARHERSLAGDLPSLPVGELDAERSVDLVVDPEWLRRKWWSVGHLAVLGIVEELRQGSADRTGCNGHPPDGSSLHGDRGVAPRRRPVVLGDQRRRCRRGGRRSEL